jgi:hypothetical protein
MIVIRLIQKLPKVLYLFLGIVLFVFIFPLLDGVSVLDIFGPVAYSIILLSIVSIIEKKNQRKMFWLYLLVIISILLVWVQYFNHNLHYNYLSFVFNVAVFMSATVIMIYQIVKSEKVTAQLVIETVSAYLLIGIMFSLTTSVLYASNPASFNIDNGTYSEFAYFSFVSLTTIGYGDISPQTELARVVTIFFGLCGQLYLTIVMALIIGKYLNSNNK